CVLSAHQLRDDISSRHAPLSGHRGAPFRSTSGEADEPGHHGGRNHLHGAGYTTSEMDAGVKGWVWLRRVGAHGGGCWGRAAGARQSTTVTLRCAGRDRRTVSGRELPRASVASLNRIEDS